MYSLKTTAAFDSAHFLYGYNGKCRNIHGHHWVIEAEITGHELQNSGEQKDMLIDFSDFKHIVKSLADSYDHSLIYEKGSLKNKTLEALREENFHLIELSCRPTAENFARLFFDTLKQNGLPISKITVYETPENGACYEEDSSCSM